MAQRRKFQRSCDIVVSFSAILILALPMAFVMLLIKISDRGPAIFSQQRIGREGKPFWLYKFRTMKVNHNGPSITPDGDPRITSVGRVLRHWKIDELPQLWNILLGDMTIIGPRPEVARFVRTYSPEQRRLLQFTPGLASLSQLVYSHEAEMLQGQQNPEEAYTQQLLPKKIAVDLEYEKRRTVWTDIRLLAEMAVFISFGQSYRTDRNFRILTSEKNRSLP